MEIFSAVVKCEKCNIYHVTSGEQGKKTESPAGIEPMTSQTPGGG